MDNNNNEAIENTGKSNLALSATVLLLMKKLNEQKKNMMEDLPSQTGKFLDNKTEEKEPVIDDRDQEGEPIGIQEKSGELYGEYKGYENQFLEGDQDKEALEELDESGSESDEGESYLNYFKKGVKNVKESEASSDKDQLHLYLKDIVENISKYIFESYIRESGYEDAYQEEEDSDQDSNTPTPKKVKKEIATLIEKNFGIYESHLNDILNIENNTELQNFFNELLKMLSDIVENNKNDQIKALKEIFLKLLKYIPARTIKTGLEYDSSNKINYKELYDFIFNGQNLVKDKTKGRLDTQARDEILNLQNCFQSFWKHINEKIEGQLERIYEKLVKSGEDSITRKKKLHILLFEILLQIIFSIRKSGKDWQTSYKPQPSLIEKIDNYLFNYFKNTFAKKLHASSIDTRINNIIEFKFIKDKDNKLLFYLKGLTRSGNTVDHYFMVGYPPSDSRYLRHSPSQQNLLYNPEKQTTLSKTLPSSQVKVKTFNPEGLPPSLSSKMPKGSPPQNRRQDNPIRNLDLTKTTQTQVKQPLHRGFYEINTEKKRSRLSSNNVDSKSREDNNNSDFVAVGRRTGNLGDVVDPSQELAEEHLDKKIERDNIRRKPTRRVEGWTGGRGKRKTRKNRKRN